MIQTRADHRLTIWYGLNDGPTDNCKMQQASSVNPKGSKAALVVPTRTHDSSAKNCSTTNQNKAKMDPKSILVSSKGSQANAKEIKKTLNNKLQSSSSSSLPTDPTNQLNNNIESPPSTHSNDNNNQPPTPVVESLHSKEPLQGFDQGPTELHPTDFPPPPPIPSGDAWEAQPIAPPEFRSGSNLLTPSSSPDECLKSQESILVSNNTLLGVIHTSLESDPDESDVDLFNKINKKDISIESELDESIFSVEEDDDFRVHFVHHGRKSSDLQEDMNHRPDLAQQITELQEAVVSMKASLKDAVTNLSLVVNDASSGAQVEEVKKKCEGNSAEILKMVLALRTDLSQLKNDVTSISNRQDSLQKSVSLLLEDRRALANDLSHAGVISQHTRNRLDCFNGVVEMIGTGGGHSGSGSHSNDSGVALMLEKPHGSFGEDSGTLQSSAGHRISDQDSLPEQPSLLVPASVYDYVAGLNQPNLSLTSSNSNGQYNSFNNSTEIQPLDLNTKEENEAKILDNVDEGAGYDSDSSLTIAANKTISLSTCLSQEIRVNDTYVSQATQTQTSHERTRKKKTPRGDSSEKQETKDSSSQSRRRRPLLGVSSTKMYQMTSHHHSSSGEKEKYKHKHRQSLKSDPREAQRYKIAKELLDTEKKYCKTLWTIQETFAEPLKKAAILSNKDIATLFPEEVYQLYDKHCLLQHQLKERLTSWKWQPIIGDILARFTDPRHCEILRIYNSYVNDFPEILKTFHKLCHTSQPFTEFIKGCLEQPSCAGQDLGAFLLTPVQRVPRYILLLKQLLKYTDSSHPDYRLINTCLERLRDFLARLNDAMENSFRLVHSSLTTTTQSASGSSNTAPTKYRTGRSPRRSEQNRKSPSSSPSDKRNRHARIYQPSSSSSEAYKSPQRSCSNAGGTNQKQTAAHMAANRSASLPRGFLSSSDSPESSGADGGPESSPERTRARSGSTSRILQKSNSSTSHENTPYHQESIYQKGVLTSARSVTNVALATTEDQNSSSRWEDLTCSEPSLIDPKNTKSLVKTTSTLTAAHSVQNMNTAHKLVTWTDSVESEESRAKKKSSIKSSIKNMFGFKKSRPGPTPSSLKNSREEPIYWPSSVSSVILESSESSPLHQPHQQYSTVTTIGDFLDEDGNPCSNV